MARVAALVASALAVAAASFGVWHRAPIDAAVFAALEPQLAVASDLDARVIARIGDARELAALPNGDLLVGTSGRRIAIVPDAEGATAAGAPQTFVRLPDPPANGVAVAPDGRTVYVATQTTVWAIPYRRGDRSEPASAAIAIAHVRTGGIPEGSDGDVHRTTSVAATADRVYVGVGSSCNACAEIDPTRASIFEMRPDGSHARKIATRFRNPIALAVDPASGALWAGGAGQDALPFGHPYEFIDDVSAHGGLADYGWPQCEENRHAYLRGADCRATVEPRVEFPAYSTLIGAAIYPRDERGPYALPAAYRGGLFVTAHGSWHRAGATYAAPPRVAFVPLAGDVARTPVDWSDPSRQWRDVIGGYQAPDGRRAGRPTGICVGSKGSVFVADDGNGTIVRLRPKR